MYNFELRPFRKHQLSQDWNKEWERFFDVFSKADNHAPPCEILDEDKSFTVSLDIPGLKSGDIDIEVKDNHLVVTGERRSPEGNVLRSERHYGKFSRVFTLPQNLKTEAIEAKFEDGVLEIRLPKEEKSETRKIKIRATSDPQGSLKN